MIKIIILTMFLFSCGAIERTFTGLTGSLTYKCSKNGIEYVQSDSGLTVHYDQDGTVARCK